MERDGGAPTRIAQAGLHGGDAAGFASAAAGSLSLAAGADSVKVLVGGELERSLRIDPISLRPGSYRICERARAGRAILRLGLLDLSGADACPGASTAAMEIGAATSHGTLLRVSLRTSEQDAAALWAHARVGTTLTVSGVDGNAVDR